MEIRTLILGPIATNTYILVSKNGKDAIVIDPAEETRELEDALKGLNVKYIFITHGHFDHIGGISLVKRLTNAPIVVHQADSGMLTDSRKNGSALFIGPLVSPEPDIIIKDENSRITAAEMEFEILFFPGHSEGCMALYNREEQLLFSGDFIFSYSIGRIDLPGGDWDKMKSSLKRVMVLSDQTKVFPGHDEPFYFGDFKRTAQEFINGGY